jgi:hypothetical protein
MYGPVLVHPWMYGKSGAQADDRAALPQDDGAMSAITASTQSPSVSTRPWQQRLVTGLLRSAYSALALPVGLAGLVVTVFGGAERASSWQRALTGRLLGSQVSSGRQGTLRVLRHGLASLPVNLLAFVLVVPIWAVFVTRGVLYPVFGAGNLEDSWGGPTLAGAWFVHFIQGPPLVLLAMALIAPVNRLQARLARRFL